MQSKLNTSIHILLEKVTLWHVVIAIILILTILSRLVGLDTRVMSHDEVNHVVPAFDLYAGRGYRQDPITHGPLQFHLMALSYFIFGDNDFSSRLPHAIFSIATVAFVMIKFRRYLGKTGSIAAGIFFVISPFMLFYGRYARNEAICAFFGVIGLFYLIRYLENGYASHLMIFIISLALNFSSKETAYIFTAQLLIFLTVLSFKDIARIQWKDLRIKKEFFLFNIAAIIGVLVPLAVSVLMLWNTQQAVQAGTITLPTLFDPAQQTDLHALFIQSWPILKTVLPIGLVLFSSLIFLMLIKEKLHWQVLSGVRAFDLLILCGTLVLPLLSAFPVIFSGIDPIAYTNPLSILSDYIFICFSFGLSLTLGYIWKMREWWKYALPFFGIYFILFTTFFTNSMGMLTGLVGSLGHWIAQQDVGRGGQPIYYFALLQIPIYEFLGAFGVFLALFIGFMQKSFWGSFPSNQGEQLDGRKDDGSKKNTTLLPVPALFIFWSILSLIAFSLAGEKMPWLTVHIAFPMLLCAGWAVNWILSKHESLPKMRVNQITYFILIILSVLLACLLLIQLFGNQAPFQGKTQQQLADTNHFLLLLTLSCISVYLLFKIEKPINYRRLFVNICLALFVLMSLVTLRSSYRAAFINYDYPYEYLVYAHAADGPKIVLEQIEEISRRLTGGLDIKVAYDNHGLYPFWWYLRNYPNKIVYLENPTRTLDEAELIIAGTDKYNQIDAIVRDNYYMYEYMRLWWPMQDYWNLNWERISSALSNPEMRTALFDIWLNRDFSLYAKVTNNQFLTLDNWLPSERMRFYVRKDIAAKMWQLNTEISLQQELTIDPYAQNTIAKQPDFFIGRSGSAPGELNAPRGIDVAPDGSIYIADSGNHRIQRFSRDGTLLDSWGVYASILEGEAGAGSLSSPWDIAVAKDGTIYIADTFNHRIQKLTPDGQFEKMWGIFRQGNDPESMWGPRGIAIDVNGHVLVTDTGNKRVVVFDKDLNFITQFGSAGFEAGQFDEPVGIAVSPQGWIAVADTWNRRVQIFVADESGTVYSPIGAFDVDAWYGTGIDNKPYIAISPESTIVISDPDSGRILEFNQQGEFLNGWEGLSTSSDVFTKPFGLDFDEQGNLWVSDGSANLLAYFYRGLGN